MTLPQAAAAVAARTESEFLARMSQALRSSLYAILGYSELMAEGEFGPLTEEQGQILARIRQNALALHGLDTEMSNRAGRDMPARLQAERRRQRSWQAIMAVNACTKALGERCQNELGISYQALHLILARLAAAVGSRQVRRGGEETGE